jgi:putative oxidoreductase
LSREEKQVKVKPILFGGAGGGSAAADFGLLVLRLFAGISLAFAHGVNKIPPSDGFLARVETMGFPFPTGFSWAAGLSEFLGGLLVALGLFTRPAAFFAGTTMAVAGFLAHQADPFTDRQMALLYLAIMVLFMFTGPGRFSVDRMVLPKRGR